MILRALVLAALLLDHPQLWGRLFGPAPPAVEPISLSVRAGERVWVEARADGDAEYSGWMEEGQELTLEAQQEIYLWCGRADRLRVRVGGEDAGTLAAITDTPSRAPGWYTFRAEAAATSL